MVKIGRLIRLPFVGLIKSYQFIFSPFVGQHCRFYPSCSNYALEALRKHQLLRAFLLIFYRIMRCHPWHAGGIDPVPANKGSEDLPIKFK